MRSKLLVVLLAGLLVIGPLVDAAYRPIKSLGLAAASLADVAVAANASCIAPAHWTLAAALAGTDTHALGISKQSQSVWVPMHSSSETPRHINTAEQRQQQGSDAAGPQQTLHKPLWPLDAADVVMFSLALFTLVLAAGGGIGGGAIYMPLYMTVGGFAAAQAVALSNLTILGGALANIVLNVQRPHPHVPGRPLIDWTLILVGACSLFAAAPVGTKKQCKLYSLCSS